MSEMVVRFVMELVMLAPYWLITALAVYMFEDGHKNKAGKYVVSNIWPSYVVYNMFVSLALAATGSLSKGFFAGLPEMRIVIVACVIGYITYSSVLKREYKRACAKFQKREEAKARMAEIR